MPLSASHWRANEQSLALAIQLKGSVNDGAADTGTATTKIKL
jgi:hypothetical protein